MHDVANSHNVVSIAVLRALGNTGSPLALKDTTKMYPTPSVSPVTVIIVLVVFPTLSLVALLVV